MASQGIPPLLEVEVSGDWPASSSGRRPQFDCRNGDEQSDLGEERIANELSLKIGIRISPRKVRQYMPTNPKRPTVPSQRWMTFVRNHAKAIIASDFFIVVTATFSARLCARDGGRDSAHPSCQRDTPSHSRVDNATVPRMCSAA